MKYSFIMPMHMDNYGLWSLGFAYSFNKSICSIGTSLMAHIVKNLPAMQET